MASKTDNETRWHEFIAAYVRLLAPGLLGQHNWLEATEIVAFPPGGAAPVNVFSIFVAEEKHPNADQKVRCINGTKRILVPTLKDWSFGIFRYGLAIDDLKRHLDDLSKGHPWQPCGKPVQIGSVQPVPVHFVPADTFNPVPWNHVLKNNFDSGSYVLEVTAPGSLTLKPLFDLPQRIQFLSEEINRHIPLRIASLADRIGSICVQIPVTAIIWAVSRASDDKLDGEVAWHPRIKPREVQFSCTFEFDATVRSFATSKVTSGTFVLPTRSDRGLHSITVWDPDNQLLLSGSGEAAFIDTVTIDIRPTDPEPRIFNVLDGNGQSIAKRISVSAASVPSLIGSGQTDDTNGATRRRMYQDETARLHKEGRFVQFKPTLTAPSVMDALEVLRDLIKTHGRTGCWLWDPYLDANDILRTLFFSPFGNSDLRALTAASTHDGNSANVATFMARERAQLEASKGNCRRLHLEFRARHGQAGWRFHDRFLIFPRTGEPALAWSLGTSINSFGQDHHILQQVGDGQLIADAFDELWDALASPDHLVWKSFP